MDTLQGERRAFLKRLQKEPLFLLKHFGALSLAVLQKVKNRLQIKFASTHRGVKLWPGWLEKEDIVEHFNIPYAALMGVLPTYPFCISQHPEAPEPGPAPNETAKDMEDYLANQRWGFLLVSLFEGSVDWHTDLSLIHGWIKNHCEKSDAAWETYSTCERIANLLVYLSIMPMELRLKEPVADLNIFLNDSLNWIFRHLEYYGNTKTNNHILNNARALVMAGGATGNKTAVASGMKIFRKCLPDLIMDGGFLRERSSHYQLVVLNWVLDAWRFVAIYKGEESEDARFLKSYAEKMAAAAQMLCDDNGQLLAMIGDISPDISPSQTSARLSELYPEFWLMPNQSICSTAMRDGWFRVSVKKEVVLGNFPQGHYPPLFPTHGHCDLTSFSWRHDGMEILADSGRYRYTADTVSLLQTSALGHNLPVVNGFAPVSETLVANGRWWPRPYANADLELAAFDHGIFLAHDGFARATPVQRHARKIIPEDNGLLVIDSFDGQGEVEVAFCWHFGEGFDTFEKDHLAATGTYGEVKLIVDGCSGSPCIEPLSGKAPGGWKSHVYGRVQPSLGFSLSWQVVLPTVISTRFALAVCAE